MEILGDSGFLIQKQSKLEAIHLQTGFRCAIYGNNVLLSKFLCLKSISWHDVGYPSHMAELCLTLKLNACHLTYLHLGVTNVTFDSECSLQDRFALAVLDMSDQDSGGLFHVLKHLSLYNMDLTLIHKSFPSLFNTVSLQSLKLRSCACWGKVLLAMHRSASKITLKTLLIQSDMEKEDEESAPALPSFLDSFERLEELYISISSSIGVVPTWRSMLAHKNTLKKLLYEQCRYMGYTCHDRGLYLSDSELLQLSDWNPLADLNLEILSISCDDCNLLVTPAYQCEFCLSVTSLTHYTSLVFPSFFTKHESQYPYSASRSGQGSV